MDRDLNEYFAGKRLLPQVRMGSNVDLGLLRALAVAEELRKDQEAGRLAKLPIRTYSAANLVPPTNNDGKSLTDEDYRRIEIRLSQPNPPARLMPAHFRIFAAIATTASTQSNDFWEDSANSSRLPKTSGWRRVRSSIVRVPRIVSVDRNFMP
jgi:hypothetical protein